MKKIQDDPAGVVDQTLVAFAEVHADLVRADPGNRLCLRATPLPGGHVALVSGGGSGHEPLHAGLVGDGMLAAAVLGDIFASPSSDQVAAAVHAADVGGGVLLIVKNYTGDKINFRVAAELAEDDGIPNATVLVADDAALPKTGSGPGRRGTAATLLVEKIAGAAAAEGQALSKVADLGQRVADAARSVGFALTSCTTPMAGRPTFELGPDEIEFGVGIHGERGQRTQPLSSAEDLAAELVDLLLADLELDGPTRLLVFTNGLGATPETELYPLHGQTLAALRARGHTPVRHLVGSYVTSLDMAGASLTLLPLDEELTRLWDAPVRTSALTWGNPSATTSPATSRTTSTVARSPNSDPEGGSSLDPAVFDTPTIAGADVATTNPGRSGTGAVDPSPENSFLADSSINQPSVFDTSETPGPSGLSRAGEGEALIDAAFVTAWMDAAAEELQRATPYLTELDAARGDADHGVNMERGFRAIADRLHAHAPTSSGQALLDAAGVLRKTMGGTTGPLWAVALRRAGKTLGTTHPASPTDLANALLGAGVAISEVGGAQEGDNTMLDALLPAARAMADALAHGQDLPTALTRATDAAQAGAADTADRVATKGRASYLGERAIGQPDPGATSAAIVVAALRTALQNTFTTPPTHPH